MIGCRWSTQAPRSLTWCEIAGLDGLRVVTVEGWVARLAEQQFWLLAPLGSGGPRAQPLPGDSTDASADEDGGGDDDWPMVKPVLCFPQCISVWDAQANFAGLPNVGETCFLNATLAALLASSACRAVVSAASELADGGLAEALARVATAAVEGVLPAAHRLRAILSQLDDRFSTRQHDASECLLELLAKCEGDALLRPLHQLFVREEHANFFCGHCDKEYEQARAIEETVLAVSVTNSVDPESLATCISSYSEPEHTPDVPCAKCGVKGGLFKSLRVEKPPDVLVVVVKRMRQSKTVRAHKVLTPIIVPLELAFCGRWYALSAVMRHHGDRMTSGHYTCYGPQARGLLLVT